MRRSLSLAALGMVVLLSGCGGNSESDSGSIGTDTTFKIYTALLPDGAEMDLVLSETKAGEWSGALNQESSDNPDETFSGLFSGNRTGNLVTAQILTDTGTAIDVQGSYQSDGTIHLTRSDMPGVSLVFRALQNQPASLSRSSVKFNLQYSGSAASTITANSTPTASDAHYTYYTGVIDKTQQKMSISVRKVQPLVILYIASPNYTALQVEQPVTSFSELTQKTVSSSSGLGQVYSVAFKTPGAKTGP